MRWLEWLWPAGKDEIEFEVRASHKPQILVDVSVIYQQDAQTGIQRVVRGILLQLLEYGVPGYAVRPVFATRNQGYHYATPGFLKDSSANAAWRTLSILPVHCEKGDIFFGLDLAAHLLPRHRAQVERWKAAGVSIWLVIHDLLPIRHGHWFRRKTVRNFRRWLRCVAVLGNGAICVSQHTERDLRLWLGENYPRRLTSFDTHVIRLGGDISATAPSQGVSLEARLLLDARLARPFVLIVGTVEPRKGYDSALDAFEHLWSRETHDTADSIPDLVIVGRRGWKTERLQRRIQTHPANQRQLFWFDDASDELLDELYRGCLGVIAPSYAEGYGLPVEEARRYGKAVLARDLPVFREAGRQAISFFSDDFDFAETLIRWTAALAQGEEPYPDSEARGWDVTRLDLLEALGISTADSADKGLGLRPTIAAA